MKYDKKSRAIFTITRHLDAWGVEYEGEILDACKTVDEARAAATRRARACQDAGQPCQINVKGERGFFAPRPGAAAEMAGMPEAVEA